MFKHTFHTSLDLKKNNFGFLRFALAFAVLYAHIFPLGNFAREPIASLLDNQADPGSLAVLGFFIISGFLVTASLFNSQTLFSYSLRRFLRIMPGFWICLILTAFLFAPLVYFSDRHTLQNFFTMDNNSFHYVKSNFLLFMHQYRIGNLLKSNPLQSAFDGSLWTLILEVKSYILLGILGALGIIKRREFTLIFFIALSIFFLLNIQIPKITNQLLHFFLDTGVLTYALYFFSGVVFYLYKDLIPFSNKLLLIVISIVVFASFFHALPKILPFTAPYIIFWLAQVLPFQHFTDLGDFSYGIYIYAFPIQQLLTHFKYNTDIIEYGLLSIFFTLLFAVLSWYIVEKPALTLKKRIQG